MLRTTPKFDNELQEDLDMIGLKRFTKRYIINPKEMRRRIVGKLIEKINIVFKGH
tara:strand:+ start:217 stop:381 length:165 start_codon:yes stop_codon:yes gene_type:complete